MKYWKGIGTKAGQLGTMDDDGFVPDSVLATKTEYDAFVAALPAQAPTDIEKLVTYAKAQGWI